MPKIIAPLTDLLIRNAKPRERPYKMFDGDGMYLVVAPTGSRIWRFKFRQANGKENTLTFGPYPEITLQDAREKPGDTPPAAARNRPRQASRRCQTLGKG